MLEPELEPKTLDAWSQRLSPEFDFWLHSPGLNQQLAGQALGQNL